MPTLPDPRPDVLVAYVPKTGDKVHLTVEAEYGHALDRTYHIVMGHGELHWISEDSRAVVRVEPAPITIPTGWGARIRATVTCTSHEASYPDVLLVRVGHSDADGNWLARDVAGYVPCCEGYLDRELSNVVVLDPGEPTPAVTE